jgi:hypothetical protein
LTVTGENRSAWVRPLSTLTVHRSGHKSLAFRELMIELEATAVD